MELYHSNRPIAPPPYNPESGTSFHLVTPQLPVVHKAACMAGTLSNAHY